jgi:hypothetical protein
MGVELSLALDKEIPEARFDGDGYALAACLGTLEKIAKERRLVPRLSSFIYDESAAALPKGQVLQETYYDPQDGLRVVNGLISALEAPDKRAWKRVDRGGLLTPLWRLLGIKSGLDGKWAETVHASLKEMRRCLELAAKNQARFCLYYF